MDSLENFVERIENFDNLSSSSQIDYFAYYLLLELKQDGFVAKDIGECFNKLHLKPYSNIPSYLSTYSKGKSKKFLKKNGNLYYLERTFKKTIDESVGTPSLPNNVKSTFFSHQLFDNTIGYLKILSNQALASYNNGIYDGCAVLLRKLVEILIIECFEKHKIENLIQKPDGSFFYLSDLITEFLKEPNWNIGRNAKKGLPKIKKIGDLSAHNRRYIARKNDLDEIRDELRIVIEELIHLIDYEHWRK